MVNSIKVNKNHTTNATRTEASGYTAPSLADKQLSVGIQSITGSFGNVCKSHDNYLLEKDFYDFVDSASLFCY